MNTNIPTTVQDYALAYTDLWNESSDIIETLTNRLIEAKDLLSKDEFPEKEVLFDFDVDSVDYLREDEQTELRTLIGEMYVNGNISNIKGLKIMIYKDKK